MNAIERPYMMAAAALRRKAVSTATRWTRQYRYSKAGPWSFDKHPWTVEMTDEDGDWVGMKAAQMGFTEVCLNRAFFMIDIRHVSVLYILPSKTPDATDFSSDRFDGALELSSHLSSLFSDVKNVGHKRAGSVNLYLRGARSRSGLKSIPAGLIVYDEFAEMAKDMVILAEERSSGQEYSQDIRISTPTIPGDNIDEEFATSSQELFEFQCPHCSSWEHLEHDNCLKICGDSPNDPDIKRTHIYCPNCHTEIPHEKKALYFSHENTRWTPSRSNYTKRGFRIPQFYSFSLEPWKIARLVMMAQSNPAAEIELFNSKYGLAKEAKGSRVDGSAYETCKNYELQAGDYPNDFDFITVGIDVGRLFHIVVNAVSVLNSWDGDPDTYASNCRTHHITAYTVKDEDEVIADLKKWRPICFCIDANPEERAAKKITRSFAPGIGYRVQYAVNRTTPIAGQKDDFILAGRTFWLDTYLAKYRQPKEKLSLPGNITLEHKTQVQNIVKHYSRTDTGEYGAKYISQGADHFGHASNYAEIAIRASILDKFGANSNITEEVF